MTLRAQEVFTPGSFPAHTYVERSGEKLENALRDAIDTSGQVVSLNGPSKSGKTVLVEKVVGQDELITVTGAGMRSPEDIWNRALDWMGAPTTQTKGSNTSASVEAEAGGTVSTSAFGFAKASGEAKTGVGLGHERSKSVGFQRSGLEQIVKEISGSDFVILVDDFHYMPREVQSEAAKSLKEAVRRGVKICTAAVRHRGDDLVRANPELRGRVRSIDLKYWDSNELNLSVDTDTLEKLAVEAAGSPHLMQLPCLNTCFVLDVRQKQRGLRNVTVSAEQLTNILEQASASTDFRSLVDVLDSGPKTRGVERKLYSFADGSRGDVYRAVLKAVASDPPRLSFAYEELARRTSAVCRSDSPIGSSITGTCLHMGRLALEKFPNERAIDWDEQKQILDIPDPYLLFYLRWSGRLTEHE